jgi:hypothetical protein
MNDYDAMVIDRGAPGALGAGTPAGTNNSTSQKRRPYVKDNNSGSANEGGADSCTESGFPNRRA